MSNGTKDEKSRKKVQEGSFQIEKTYEKATFLFLSFFPPPPLLLFFYFFFFFVNDGNNTEFGYAVAVLYTHEEERHRKRNVLYPAARLKNMQLRGNPCIERDWKKQRTPRRRRTVYASSFPVHRAQALLVLSLSRRVV